MQHYDVKRFLTNLVSLIYITYNHQNLFHKKCYCIRPKCLETNNPNMPSLISKNFNQALSKITHFMLRQHFVARSFEISLPVVFPCV